MQYDQLKMGFCNNIQVTIYHHSYTNQGITKKSFSQLI